VTDLRETVRGEIEDGDSELHFVERDSTKVTLTDQKLPPGFDAALHRRLDCADAHLGRDGLAAVGHRVVHGGADHIAPELIVPALFRGCRPASS
jgi:acetate kinase